MMLFRGGLIASLATCFLVAGTIREAGAQSPAAKTGDRELGQYLSSMCTTCHQVTGRSVGAIPPIIAWPEDQFVAVIQSYKEGVRDNETMRTISHRLSQEDIEALAAYFGALTLQPAVK